jgi:hypothetical protein
MLLSQSTEGGRVVRRTRTQVYEQMVDTRIRKNERCVIDLPACDYVFSSTRSCFIAYGFSTSAMERDILKALLQDRGIEPVEAGGTIEPAKFAFCIKICSKIITSQFCIVLANHDRVEAYPVVPGSPI